MIIKNSSPFLELSPTQESELPACKYQQWPSLWDTLAIFMRNKKVLITFFCVVLGVGLVVLRLWPKQYASVAVVAAKLKESANPVQKWGDPNLSVLEQSKYALDDFKSALFSYDIVRSAAEETGIITGTSVQDAGMFQNLKNKFWKALGGEFSDDAKALQRQFLDILRYKKINIENMSHAVPGGVASDLTLIKITNLNNDPLVAQKFLQRLLELYKQKLEKEDSESNKNMAAFYDDQIKYFSELMTNSGGDSSLARSQLQVLNSKKDDLKRKLQEEADLTTNIELQMTKLRQDLVDVESKYSDKHPLTIKTKEQYKESSGRIYIPLYKLRKEIQNLKNDLDAQFQDLIKVTGATYEGSGVSGEGHTEYFTQKRTELRGISKVYETMQERYLQALVQNKLDDHSAPSRFEIVEAASIPLRPYSPSLTPGLLVVLLGSLLGALFGVLLIEFRFPKVRDRWLVSLRSHLPLWAEQSAVASTVIEQNSASIFAKPILDIGGNKNLNSTNAIVIEGLSYLIAKVACYNSGSLFQCGFVSLSDNNIHAQVVYNMGITLSDVNFGNYNVLIVSDNHEGSLLSAISPNVKCKGDDERFYDLSSQLVLFDASGMALNESIVIKACNLGCNAILWDLPECNSLMWRGINMPLIPLVGVVEADDNAYADIMKNSKIMEILVTQKNFPIGLYLAGIQESILNYNTLLWGKKVA